MLFEKLSAGVVEIVTPLGRRYLRLTFRQRLAFLWTFRNFGTLPQQVLSASELNLVQKLCAAQAFVTPPAGEEGLAIIGSIERFQVPVLEPPVRRPMGRAEEPAITPMAADASRKP